MTSDSRLDTELCRACLDGDETAVGELLARGASASATTPRNGWTALQYACTCPGDGGAKLVALLSRSGASVNEACRNGASPLVRAAFKGHPRCLQALLDLGGDATLANTAGSTPLHSAAAKGHAACVTLLLPHCDASARNTDGETAADRARATRRGDCDGTLAALAQASAPWACGGVWCDEPATTVHRKGGVPGRPTPGACCCSAVPLLVWCCLCSRRRT